MIVTSLKPNEDFDAYMNRHLNTAEEILGLDLSDDFFFAMVAEANFRKLNDKQLNSAASNLDPQGQPIWQRIEMDNGEIVLKYNGQVTDREGSYSDPQHENDTNMGYSALEDL